MAELMVATAATAATAAQIGSVRGYQELLASSAYELPGGGH
jgi:hypothetical protein